MVSGSRSYNVRNGIELMNALNSLQTPFDIIEARRKAGIKPNWVSIKDMKTYLHRIGYAPSDLNRLNIVHVAGSKGKGSTCAFVDSILSQYQHTKGTPRKTGLFTSPHLIAVRERIRINSIPISEDLFAKYFFEVWDRLESAPEDDAGELIPPRPIYARYLTLMSWHVFLQEGIDVAVYETGIGGEFDATNVVEKPVASGISTLGIDHVFALGDTVAKIAWHKAGIMKTGSAAFTIEQVPDADEVLKKRAAEKDVDLKVLEVDSRLSTVDIRPDAIFQKRNATLAIALAETALEKIGVSLPPRTELLPKEFVDGLEKVVWRGRCEVKKEGKVTWHVDGAHTSDSLKMSAKWFKDETVGRNGPRVMIFNQQGRSEAVDFLESVFKATRREGQPAFDHVIFCTNVTYAASGYKRDFVNRQFDPAEIEKMTVQQRFAEKWTALDPTATVKVMPTIEQSINYVRHIGENLPEGETVQTFITGSLHLVGGALGILEKADTL
ncbi:folylpolyglutamate synthase [Fusarium austroafricanum]|uniref:Folylpolyglutamate synthase n=1 Tax=Fusarium austroafricanum TaxID=2364996 RepID=A0A8H4NNA4_9HYPO|nr:folylpolyglutamate synthase [Fusarium austroafricanum]